MTSNLTASRLAVPPGSLRLDLVSIVLNNDKHFIRTKLPINPGHRKKFFCLGACKLRCKHFLQNSTFEWLAAAPQTDGV